MTTASDRYPTYVGDGDKYMLPNDSTEQTRLEEQAAAVYELLGNRTYHAPVSSPNRIVDIGCGTGITTVLMATGQPNARVVGIDLSVVPDLHVRPANVEFLQGDIHELAGNDPRLEWGSMDLVYSRFLLYAITDWPAYVRLAVKLAKPGGYIELQDIEERCYKEDNKQPEEVGWMTALQEGAARTGMDLDCGLKLEGWMREAGLEIVEVRKYKCTVGEWLKNEVPETARLGRHMMDEDNGVKGMFHHVIEKILKGQRSEVEIKDYQKQCSETFDVSKKLYQPIYAVVGRKPLMD